MTAPESSSAPATPEPPATRPDATRRAWLAIDAEALAHNLRVIAGLAGPAARIAAVVKADAYGHGLVPTAHTFLEAGAGMLCVATVDEALALRAAGVAAPVLLLYSAPVAAIPDLAAAHVTIPISSEDGARELLDLATRPGRGLPTPIVVHLEVETGLTRMGVPVERCASAAGALRAGPGVTLEGLWSHLADPGDPDVTAAQCARFERAVSGLRGAGIDVPLHHMAASGGLIAGTAPAYQLVRPGLALYGVVPDGLPIPPDRRATAASLRPAMSLIARPIRLLTVPPGTAVSYGGRWVAERTSVIATLPVGYGDGYARGTGPGAEVLVRGRRAAVVGSITMDALMVDVTGIPGVGPDDEFVLLGAQGDDRIDVLELARRRTTITWEVLTAMARRIPRVYHPCAGGAA